MILCIMTNNNNINNNINNTNNNNNNTHYHYHYYYYYYYYYHYYYHYCHYYLAVENSMEQRDSRDPPQPVRFESEKDHPVLFLTRLPHGGRGYLVADKWGRH